jgi:glycosyltransferase involved in cell wall biosynthesis
MTSFFEGISITTIEAMACEIPTILYDVPGLRDFNKTGENSILIQDDYLILAEKIIYLNFNPQISNKISLNAREMVINKFDMKANISQILNLYKKHFKTEI